MSTHAIEPPVSVFVEHITELGRGDMEDLCDAAEAAIVDGNGFGWLTPPPRSTLESYWRGVLVMPRREVFVGRLDSVIAASAQLAKPAPNQESSAFAATLTTQFVAPWARGHGLARGLALAIEKAARDAGLRVLNLDLRETQDAAIKLYESLGYQRWGTHPHYAWIDDRWVAGYFYHKDLTGNGARP